MLSFLCLTIRFLEPYSHGRGVHGDPEWPPSPLRVFQALVAASAARWNERMRIAHAVPALQALAREENPLIVAAAGIPSAVKRRLYFPDNVADKVARAWSAGREGSIADYPAEKDVRPMCLKGEAVHYLFPLTDVGCPQLEVLASAARSVTHLGWGVDMVTANASVVSKDVADALPGERWMPVPAGGVPLRVPIEGTLSALISRHEASLNRLGPDGYHPVPPLSAFRVVGYARATDSPGRPFAAFSILKPDATAFRPYDAVRRSGTVAGMVRSALGDAAKRFRPRGWTDDDVTTNVYGHSPNGDGPARNGKSEQRFLYLPLPTISPFGVESIRRVLVVGPPGGNDSIAWVRQALSGAELFAEGRMDSAALLTTIPSNDQTVQRYVRESMTWSTVTPVLLPGYDDPKHLRRRLNRPEGAGSADEQRRLLQKLDERIDGLLRKAILQAGYSETLAGRAELEWRQVGFLRGVGRATDYVAPENLRQFPRWHVRVHWRDDYGNDVRVKGPLALGAGRFRGFGVFATE